MGPLQTIKSGPGGATSECHSHPANPSGDAIRSTASRASGSIESPFGYEFVEITPTHPPARHARRLGGAAPFPGWRSQLGSVDSVLTASATLDVSTPSGVAVIPSVGCIATPAAEADPCPWRSARLAARLAARSARRYLDAASSMTPRWRSPPRAELAAQPSAAARFEVPAR